MANFELHNADFREVPNVERLCSLVIDPPYCSGGMQERQRTRPEGTVEGFAGKEGLLNDSLSTADYQRMMRKAFCNPFIQEVYCFFDRKMYLPTFECSEDAGFCVRGLLVWDKMNPVWVVVGVVSMN